MSDNLPPLPECPGLAGYTDGQMRAYARAALAAQPPNRTVCGYPDCKCPTESPCLQGLSPAPPAQAQEPLTDEQIDAAMRESLDHLLDIIYEYGTISSNAGAKRAP